MPLSALITWETGAAAVGVLLAIALFGLLVIRAIGGAWRAAASKRRGGRDARQGTNKRRGGARAGPRRGPRSWFAASKLARPVPVAIGKRRLRLAALSAVILAACVAAAAFAGAAPGSSPGASAQKLAPRSHDIPKPPAPPGAAPDAGGAPFADVRARVPMDATGREFRQDQLEDRDVLYNLQLFFHQGSPPGRIACPDGGEPTRLSAVVLEGVHQHEQALRFTADTRAAGAVHTSSLFLRAIAYFRGHGLDGRCEGRELRGAVELVRLTDGAWFAPEWRRTLVKRR